MAGFEVSTEGVPHGLCGSLLKSKASANEDACISI
jgi:hypothetical protein